MTRHTKVYSNPSSKNVSIVENWFCIFQILVRTLVWTTAFVTIGSWFWRPSVQHFWCSATHTVLQDILNLKRLQLHQSNSPKLIRVILISFLIGLCKPGLIQLAVISLFIKIGSKIKPLRCRSFFLGLYRNWHHCCFEKVTRTEVLSWFDKIMCRYESMNYRQ